jgi:hypothetical protein
VAFELQRQEHQEIELTVRSIDTDTLLLENPFLKTGLQTIQRAKREDKRGHFPEALHFYEEGACQSLDAVRRGRVPLLQADSVRVKCLLLHDRCELIRDHLERGAPLKVRKQYLDSFENSLESSATPSPELLPEDEEERTFLMEEVKSAVASVSGSTHSLYPTCVEIKRSSSAMSGHSDFHKSNKVIAEKKKAQVSVPDKQSPLVDLDQELRLSMQSLHSRASSAGSSSLLDEEHQMLMPRSISCASINKDDSYTYDDDLLLQGKLSDSSLSLGQRDRNISELTYMNSMVDGLLREEGNKAGNHNDSGSDSGFSDPSTEGTTALTVAQVTSPSSRKSSPTSDVDSMDIVPSLPVSSPVPPKTGDSPTPSSGASSVAGAGNSRRRRSGNSRSNGSSSGSSVKFEPEHEKVTVLSEETVVEPKVAVSSEVYTKARSGQRPEYVPSRARAREQEEEEDDVNKGCYYFMACLDSFWIL